MRLPFAPIERLSCCLYFAAIAIGAIAIPAFGQTGDVTSGRAFAQAHCATCHAIGPTGVSPYAPAPPFRTLHERYNVENLAEALAEGIVVGHTGERQMPEFVLSDLIAYLKSLEQPAKATGS